MSGESVYPSMYSMYIFCSGKDENNEGTRVILEWSKRERVYS